ncbi:hypothetical protein E4T39_01817 [Aureobasidium subglaciale]|nr:hypothetical protein E4T39_01817 [Aureobasidium subglaciale]
MRPQLVILAIGLFAFVRGQVVGTDGITTVATATCLSTGTQTYAYLDPSGIQYRYQCGAGSGGTSTAVIPSASVSSWQACFAYCDNFAGCNGFTYNNGAVNGNGPGQCILKAGTVNTFASTATLTATRIAGLQARYIPSKDQDTKPRQLTNMLSIGPSPTFSCPQQDQQTVTDTYGQAYVIQCAHDISGGTGPGMLGQAANNFNDCFAQCDNFTPSPTETQFTTCNGFGYSGAANGAGPGNCYLKYASVPLSTNPATNTNNVGAIRVVAASATTTSTSSSLSSSSSSVAASSTPAPSPTLVGCSQGNGSTYTDSSGTQFLLYCDRTYSGYIDTSFGSPDLSSCLQACTNDTQCQAAIYENGVCNLKYNLADGQLHILKPIVKSIILGQFNKLEPVIKHILLGQLYKFWYQL